MGANQSKVRCKPAPRSAPAVIPAKVDADALALIKRANLAEAWDFACDLVPHFFPGTQQLLLSISASVDDDQPVERLSLKLRNSMPARAFMDAAAVFFESIRKHKPELYPVLVVRQTT
ncbi:MAG TPA: hypothetical protein VGP72_15990 [Planctomycetota bacterium]|jgi:hypothetical protein